MLKRGTECSLSPLPSQHVDSTLIPLRTLPALHELNEGSVDVISEQGLPGQDDILQKFFKMTSA